MFGQLGCGAGRGGSEISKVLRRGVCGEGGGAHMRSWGLKRALGLSGLWGLGLNSFGLSQGSALAGKQLSALASATFFLSASMPAFSSAGVAR